MMTTAELIHYHASAATLSLTSEPDRDFTPIVLVEGDGKTTLVSLNGVGLHPYEMLMIIAERIRTEMHPVRVSLSVDTWVTRGQFASGEVVRSEAIHIAVVSVEGQASAMLPYERTPDGIVVSDVERADEGTEDGRMFDALRSMLVTDTSAD